MNTTSSPSTGNLSAMHSAPAGGLHWIDWLAMALMIIGSINWGLVGLANFDLVAAILGQGSTLSRIVYALVGLAGLYGIVVALKLGNRKSA